MRNFIASSLLILLSTSSAVARTVVFWEEGFPTVASQPVTRGALEKSLGGMEPVFAGLDTLKDPPALDKAELLVMPYGSAVPADAWSAILTYLRSGGNLLVIGGQPFRVPVTAEGGIFHQQSPQDVYSRALGIWHTYEALHTGSAKFMWKQGYEFFRTRDVQPRRSFVLEGDFDGLAYMVNAAGEEVSAPLVVADHTDKAEAMFGSRVVMLDFEPEPGYWDSSDGTSLIREAARYASQGAARFWLETQFATVKPGERAQLMVRLRSAHGQRQGLGQPGRAKVELLSGSTVVESVDVTCPGNEVDAPVAFQAALRPGFYIVRATYYQDQPREFYQNAFWVEDEQLLRSGPALGVKGDFLTRDGKPYFPFGTNYFTTERSSWDLSGPRNAWIWEKDFADMANHGVTFVRTGVWSGNMQFVEPSTGGVNERFLRNLEAYLLCARRHNIIVNFTFFAFDPQTILRHPDEESLITGPGTNPYTDPVAISAEQAYLLSIVNRFKNVPWLCWDLINEPSFSNPKRLWKGNTPNRDTTEVGAWRKWLKNRYGKIEALAMAWSVTPDELGGFDNISLPDDDDLSHSRSGNPRQVRAVDYNLFAQDMFSNWVCAMVAAIRSTGSSQLVDVGQDEGGVSDRVLNQFYGAAGVAFTTNHTYWRDDALLWDSVVARRPRIPNIVGETGYQPVWRPDGAWRYDEITASGLLERKWALGFAAANSGSLQWDWSREGDFGMKRSDGSAKLWQGIMREMGAFAENAASWATGLIEPDIAIVLPQSLQLSVLNATALEAQAKCVRALYHYARLEAYVAGEYQIELLGNPKLIIVPSPWVLSDSAWEAILVKVKRGATLLISGLFDDDPHFHSARRQTSAGIDYEHGLLSARDNLIQWPGGEAWLTYSGDKTTYLERAVLPGGKSWSETKLGQGRILFVPLPLELNDNLQAIGDIYRYAAEAAGAVPMYSTALRNPGILICPTRFPHATLYVLTSESGEQEVSFRDAASNKEFSGKLEPGSAAMLLAGERGELLAAYNWPHR
jgi:hypothetical protein